MAIWISVMEAAARLKVSHVTVRNLLARGKLRGKKLRPFNFQVVDAASVKRVARERTRARR